MVPSGTKNNLNNHQPTIAHPMWVGVFVACLILIGSFWSLPKAHAAESLNNIELAKKVIKEVAPIVSTNQLDASNSTNTNIEDYIEKPLVVETQITAAAPVQSAKKSSKKTDDANIVHYFPYGYCTYYVSQKRTVTWSGNAGTWLKGAKGAGLKTGDEPKVGAIMVTSEGGKAGHVAYVEAVLGDQVTISEMNFKGYGIISSRTIASSSKFIKGYIY